MNSPGVFSGTLGFGRKINVLHMRENLGSQPLICLFTKAVEDG